MAIRLSVPISASLDGAHVLIRTQSQLNAALALIALDGIAARLVIAPPDLEDEYLPDVIARAGIDTLVTDGAGHCLALRHVTVSPALRSGGDLLRAGVASEWVMFTSGTTGAPKMVAHTLEALTGAIKPSDEKAVWGTFYDIRRYGGLQILLRAVIGDASLILSEPEEPVADFLIRLGQGGVTHLTGTPSHWRRALMSPAISHIAPRYVRLSGEIADQAVLDSLKLRFPDAAIGHAYASTEAGVGFEVTDGLEGFPAEFVGRPGPVEMKVVDGSLQIRSARTASNYVGGAEALGEDGFVDTGDIVELRGGRYYFAGRRGGIINVGGLKIHPEEVEAVINRHPAVRLSRVSGRKSPITGAIVVAEVVLDGGEDRGAVEKEILRDCRARLKPFEVPAVLRFGARAGIDRRRKAGAPWIKRCAIFWSVAARAAWDWPSCGKLVADGYRVIALARKEAMPGRSHRQGARRCDAFRAFLICRSLDGIPDLVRELKAEHGPLYGLVNNAALGTEGLLSNMHNSDIEKLVRVNTLSPIILSKYAVRGMITAGEGRIVNISSIIATTGYSGLSVYGATKAATLGFTRSLAREAGRLGVTVNAVAPGFVATEMTQEP